MIEYQIKWIVYDGFDVNPATQREVDCGLAVLGIFNREAGTESWKWVADFASEDTLVIFLRTFILSMGQYEPPLQEREKE